MCTEEVILNTVAGLNENNMYPRTHTAEEVDLLGEMSASVLN